MKKIGLFFMLAAMLAAPMLACGFPLPAGTASLAVAKAVCAENELAETCQARQDAFQMMDKLQSASVPDLQTTLIIQMEGNASIPKQDLSLNMTGSYEYVVAETDEGLGARLRIRIEEGTMVNLGDTVSLSGTEIILIGTQSYASRDGGQTWESSELDSNVAMFLSLAMGIAGPSGASLDLYSDPAIFDVMTGPAEDYDGQAMQAQTLTVDVGALMAATSVLEKFVAYAEEVTGQTLLDPSSGFSLEMLKQPMVSAGLLLFLTGTELTTTLHIGQDDGLIHYVSENHIFNMDAGSNNAQFGGPIHMEYTLSGHVEQFDEPLVIEPPTNATESTGGDTLFGGELGQSLFGQ